MVHPDDQEMVQRALDTTLSTGQPLKIDHKIVLPDGPQRVISLNAVPVFDDLGNISTVIGTVQDITERVRIEKELLEKERLTKEMDIGQSIQLSLLPKACPSVEGWQFAAFYQAARQVGGDFYDFISLPNGKIGLVIADVAGKGVPAALMMSLSRAVVRTIALNGSGPSRTLTRSNQVLYNDYSQSAFITACYASIDPKDGRMEFATAGHNGPSWYSSRSGECLEIHSKGIVLGLFPEVSIDQETIELMPGDVLVFYTDGLIEARNEQKEFYETSRLVDILSSNAHKNAMDILDAIVHSWESFVGDSPQEDDLTIVVVKRNMPKDVS
jgi:sigma-B regulation protein RsbU (phosphoserine phosphatase)